MPHNRSPGCLGIHHGGENGFKVRTCANTHLTEWSVWSTGVTLTLSVRDEITGLPHRSTSWPGCIPNPKRVAIRRYVYFRVLVQWELHHAVETHRSKHVQSAGKRYSQLVLKACEVGTLVAIQYCQESGPARKKRIQCPLKARPSAQQEQHQHQHVDTVAKRTAQAWQQNRTSRQNWRGRQFNFRSTSGRVSCCRVGRWKYSLS